jgi:hypothetical protein
VALTGFRRQSGWVGVAQRISFASEHVDLVPDDTSENEASSADPVILDRLALQRELDAIDAHVRQRLEPGWVVLQPATHGGFVRSRWCGPPLSEAECSASVVGADAEPEGDWIELDLVRDPAAPDQVIGYVYRAGARSGELALTLSYARGGGQVVRPGFSMEITRRDAGGSEVVLPLGTTTELRAGPLRCVVNAPGLPAHDGAARDVAIQAELERLLESPSSLRDSVDAQLVELLEQAEAALDAEAPGATRCSWQGPAPADRAPLLEEARRIIDARRSIVDVRANEIHSLIEHALPRSVQVADQR